MANLPTNFLVALALPIFLKKIENFLNNWLLCYYSIHPPPGHHGKHGDRDPPGREEAGGRRGEAVGHQARPLGEGQAHARGGADGEGH